MPTLPAASARCPGEAVSPGPVPGLSPDQPAEIVGVELLGMHLAHDLRPVAAESHGQVGLDVAVPDATVEVLEPQFVALVGERTGDPIGRNLQLGQLEQCQDRRRIRPLDAQLGRELALGQRQADRAVDVDVVVAELGLDRERVVAAILGDRADRPAEHLELERPVAGGGRRQHMQGFRPVRVQRDIERGLGQTALELRQLQLGDGALERQLTMGQQLFAGGPVQRAVQVPVQPSRHVRYSRGRGQIDALRVEVEVGGEVLIERPGGHPPGDFSLRQRRMEGLEPQMPVLQCCRRLERAEIGCGDLDALAAALEVQVAAREHGFDGPTSSVPASVPSTCPP